MVETVYGKTPRGGSYAKIFYKDSKGRATSREKACQAFIHEYSENGELLQSTIMLMNGWYPGKEEPVGEQR